MLFAVAKEKWGRLVGNAKGGNFDEKWLVEVVVNAGVFAEPPSLDVRRDFMLNAYR